MLRTMIPAKIASISAGQLHRLYRALPGKRLLGAMAGIRPTRDAAYFQRMYDADPDPWHFRTSEYEQARFRRTLETLPARHFRSAFEVGCSIGVLTQQLAPRCGALLGVDIVEQPLVAARDACTDQPWVQFRQMKVPDEWPGEFFDLIVLSEVLYFLSPKDVIAVADRVCSSLDSTGLVLLVNWRGRSGDPAQAARRLACSSSGRRRRCNRRCRSRRTSIGWISWVGGKGPSRIKGSAGQGVRQAARNTGISAAKVEPNQDGNGRRRADGLIHRPWWRNWRLVYLRHRSAD